MPESDPGPWMFAEVRRRQHQEFLALPFRENLARLEEMQEVAERFAAPAATASAARTARL